MTKRLAACLFLCSFAAALTLAPTRPALAHAAYKDSDPGDESTVASAPSSVWAEFTEPLSEGSKLEIFDPCGVKVDRGDVEISGYRMSVSMASDVQGTFTASFFANSALDSHNTSGEFEFTVTQGEPCPDAETQEPRSDDPRNEVGPDTDGPAERQDPSEPQVAAAPSSEDDPDGGRAPGHKRSRASDRSKDGPGDVVDDELQLAARERPQEPSVFDDVPWGAFAFSMLLALLIGAAGGKVYAGIMGPNA